MTETVMYGCVEDEEDYIKVAADEDSDFMEFPREDDGTIMFSTIQAQFPSAVGIKYKGPSGAFRAIRAVDNVLAPPKGGWGDRIYLITVLAEPAKETAVEETRKRKWESAEEAQPVKKSADVDPLTRDLPVTGLPYKCSEDDLREYFENKYGELEVCEVKMDRTTGNSRGFGFIRFKDIEHAREALNNQHELMGRTITVKLKVDTPMKLFIGRLPQETTSEELHEYFSQFGKVCDVFLPTPFRKFAFVTYASKEDAIKVLRKIKKHEFKGSQLNVEEHKKDQNDRRGLGGNRQVGPSSRDRGRDLDRDCLPFRGGYNTLPDRRQQQQQQHQRGDLLGGNRQLAGDLKTILFNLLQ